MKTIKIKNRYTGETIISGEYESIKDCLEKNKKANLWGADLWKVDLRGANLRGADLRGAKGINKYLTTPLYLFYDQENPIRAYKLVDNENEGIYSGGLKYEIGKEVSVKNYDTNETNSCGQGINLATLEWCLREYQKGYKILICEFNKEDIVAIPVGSDGKFRVKRCKVEREKDLKELGF